MQSNNRLFLIKFYHNATNYAAHREHHQGLDLQHMDLISLNINN